MSFTLIQVRRGTAAAWTSANPTLAAGEIGFETDTGRFKIGDGSTTWVNLAYAGGRSSTSGTAIGIGAANSVTTGTDWTAIGRDAGASNTTGSHWTAIGRSAGEANTTGTDWTALGRSAGASNTTGSGWMAIGRSAGVANTTGVNWTAIGAFAAESNTTGSDWTAIGRSAGAANTTGGGWTAIGRSAGIANTTGFNWIAIGAFSGSANTTGSDWTAIGRSAGAANTTGGGWTAIGRSAGLSNVTGTQWTAIGAEAGLNGTAYSRCVFVGFRAGRDETNSDRLYIEPTESARPLIFGRFDSDDLTIFATDAGTSNVDTTFTLDRASTGTPADGFGVRTLYALASSTTASQSAAAIDALWATATHASRAGRLVISAFDATAAREGIRVEADGSAARLGFYGATAVVRPTVSAAATDLTTVIALANSLRTALINLGLVV